VNRQNQIQHRYVEFIPKDLDEGILYISTRFKTASHLCCCGCGSKVVTPLNPAKWRLVDHGSAVSLSPSIDAQTHRAQHADEYASQVYTGERFPAPPSAQDTSISSAHSTLRELTSGNNQKALNKDRVSNMCLPLAPVEEQRQIVAGIEARMSVIEKMGKDIELEIERAQALRHSILTEAFSGKLAPQDTNDEPASLLLERIRWEKAGLQRDALRSR
jgi:hypothetical protein